MSNLMKINLNSIQLNVKLNFNSIVKPILISLKLKNKFILN